MNAPSTALLDTAHAETQMTALVDRARHGDVKAFAALYASHHRRVYALCLRLTADPARAEELTQDAFVHAWRGLPDFRGDARFSTWLHRVAVNAVLADDRSRARRRSGVDESSEDALAIPDPRSPPALERDLERAIARLPTRARQVFVLVDVEGYSHEETAGALHIAVGTSKAHLFRARALLREMLS